ncbi:hypothetical protein ACF0H5_020773 [Mactra antiquata]
MAELTVPENESSISSVRSNVSDASSGYAFVSVPTKQRNALKDVYPHEPPPDYDEKQSPVKFTVTQSTPLLVDPNTSPTNVTFETKQPFLTSGRKPDQVQTESRPRSIIRINSADVSIEIVNSAQSPNSTTTDTEFFPREQPQGCCRTCSKSTKIKLLFALLLIMVVVLVLVLINFLACIGDFTSACK